jgi:uncharacterized protein YbaR (Trm112 family)
MNLKVFLGIVSCPDCGGMLQYIRMEDSES